MAARAEFTVEPFEEGNPGPHVQAAIAGAAPLTPDIGPFGTTVEGSVDEVLTAVQRITRAAMEAGATRLSLHLTVVQ